MSRLLRSDLEAEAAALHAEARHIERELTCAGLSDDQLLAATRAMVDPRDNAADALLEAKRALDSISPLGIGRRPAPKCFHEFEEDKESILVCKHCGLEGPLP